jgi:hypothetical protein
MDNLWSISSWRVWWSDSSIASASWVELKYLRLLLGTYSYFLSPNGLITGLMLKSKPSEG